MERKQELPGGGARNQELPGHGDAPPGRPEKGQPAEAMSRACCVVAVPGERRRTNKRTYIIIICLSACLSVCLSPPNSPVSPRERTLSHPVGCTGRAGVGVVEIL